nr:MAG TPA: holin [Caudoviricetes sp.]
MFTRDFWVDTLERAIRTACQAALSAGVVGGVGLFQVDWLNVCGVALVAAIASVLTCVASSGKTDSISPASFATSDKAKVTGKHIADTEVSE